MGSKKKFAAVAVTAVVAATMCIGCKAYADEAAFDRLTESAVALAQRDYYTADINGDMDLSIKMAQGGASANLDIKGNAQGIVAYQAEPFAVEMTMNANADLAGQQSASFSGSMFVVDNEDGTGTLYTKSVVNGEDNGWQVASIEKEQFDEFKRSLNADSDLSQVTGLFGELTNTDVDVSSLQAMLSDNMAIEPESQNIRGYECDAVSCAIDGASVLSLVNLPTDDMSGVLAGVKCDIQTAIDKNSNLPVQVSIDLSGSDFSDLAAMFTSVTSESDKPAEVSVENKALGLTVSYDYDSPATVIVPEEAKQAEQPDTEPEQTEPGEVGYDPKSDMPQENPDGSYVMSVSKGEDVSIMLPEGFNATYADEDYFAADTEDYMWSAYYTTEYYSSMDDEVALLTDESFYTKSGYTDFEIKAETPLKTAGGKDAFCVARKYKSGDMVYLDTCILVDYGDYLIVINTTRFDENMNPVEITADEMQMFADSVL